MSDLLKEAIADAKAVRETALQNAKMALEEAFTPQLKSMLVAKLKEDDIEEGGWNEDDEMGDEEEPEAEPEEEPEEMMGKDEMSHDEMSYEDDEMGDDEMGDEEGEEDMEEEGLELEDIIRELEAELSEDAYEEDLGESEESEDKPVEEASEEWGVGAAINTMGSNSRVRAKRAREELAWNPSALSLIEEIEHGCYTGQIGR